MILRGLTDRKLSTDDTALPASALGGHCQSCGAPRIASARCAYCGTFDRRRPACEWCVRSEPATAESLALASVMLCLVCKRAVRT